MPMRGNLLYAGATVDSDRPADRGGSPDVLPGNEDFVLLPDLAVGRRRRSVAAVGFSGASAQDYGRSGEHGVSSLRSVDALEARARGRWPGRGGDGLFERDSLRGRPVFTFAFPRAKRRT